MTTGKVVYNKKITLVYSKLQKRYTLNESYPLPTKGRYKMELTYQCCDENKILESLQATPKVKTYA